MFGLVLLPCLSLLVLELQPLLLPLAHRVFLVFVFFFLIQITLTVSYSYI